MIAVVGLAWQARASCRDHDLGPDAWDEHVDGETALERDLRHELAADVCAVCPVAQACLDDSLAGRGGGVRAGYVFEDVDHLLDETRASASERGHRKAEPAECGTARGARAHRYRQQDPCDPCLTVERAEHAARQREYRARKRRRALEEVPA